MKTFIPGTMSARYLQEVNKHQSQFLASITEKPEDTARYDAAYASWVKSTFRPPNPNAEATINAISDRPESCDVADLRVTGTFDDLNRDSLGRYKEDVNPEFFEDAE